MDIRFRLSRSVPALVEFDAAVPGDAQMRLFPPPKDFTLSALQQLTNAMQVGSHHHQRTCALKFATVSSDNWDQSVDLGELVRATYLTMLNEARSIVLEFKSAFTQICRETSTANLLQTI